MKFIRRYRLVILGGVFLVFAIFASGREGIREAPDERVAVSLTREPPAPAPSPGENAVGRLKSSRSERQSSRSAPVRLASVEEPPGDEAVEDSTGDAAVEFDPNQARASAQEEVKNFNAELAATLRTINPNARKTRIRAAGLRQKAGDLDDWIEAQDSSSSMTSEERQEWEAQRQVWVNHSRELKLIAQRLSATRGTKRKVRILAREIGDSLND